jgi:hypothetical protein
MKKAVTLACAGMLAAQAHPVRADEGFTTRIEALSYRSSTDTWARSPFQRIAPQADHVWSTEVRPDLAWQGEQLAGSLRPRLLVNAEPGEHHTSSWLNEGWLRWRPTDGVSLQGGREVLLWGPAMFWNPSNPFFTDSNKANPKREIAGEDFLRARWQIDPHFALSGLSQIGRGHRDAGVARRDGVKLDWVGEDASAAAIVAAEPDKAPSWQGWGQWTASDALLLYGEMAWRQSAAPAVAQPATSPTGWSLSHPPGKRQWLALIGSAYTFENDWTVNAELWRNGAGLNDQEAMLLARTSDALASQPRGLADQQLGSLLNQPTPLRRHYAGLQLSNGDASRLSWKLRLTRNLDDSSMESVAIVDYDLNDSLKLWFNLMRRTGRADSEYGRWVRGSSMLGVTWYAW